jgi:hypothetical protein
VSNIIFEGKLRMVLETQEFDTGFKVEGAERTDFVRRVEYLRKV